MKIAVIGAGISGVAVGRMLQERGKQVIVYEGSNKIGGLIQCEIIAGNLFHKVGGHVFNAKDKVVHEWFWQHFNRDKEFIRTERNAKILLEGKLIGYPIENYLYALPAAKIPVIVHELLAIYRSGYKEPFTYPHFEAFLKGNFGETLFKLYFESYNKKIWQTDLKTVAMEWLEGKLPMPDIEEVLTRNITRAKEKSMVHSSFYYPKHGGSQFIIDRLATGLNIALNKRVTKLEYKNDGWLINGEGPFDQIIYTGDVRNLYQMLESVDEKVLASAGQVANLKANGTSNLFCYTDDTDLSWLYLPDSEKQAHRIIYTGNFSSANNNPKKRRKTCVVEFSGEVELPVMLQEINKLPGNLAPVVDNRDLPVHNYQPNSYVIQDSQTRALIDHLKKTLQPYNFFLLGRFAEWEYYNMDKAIYSAIGVNNKIR